MKYLLSLLLASVVLFSSCKESVNAPKQVNEKFSKEELNVQNRMKDDVMVIHDTAMARMAEIHRLVKKLKSLIPSGELTDESKNAVYDQIKFLEDADDSMMSWMQEIRLPSALRDSMTHTQIMEYLAQENQKISVVATKIDKSIESGTDLLKMLQKGE